MEAFVYPEGRSLGTAARAQRRAWGTASGECPGAGCSQRCPTQPGTPTFEETQNSCVGGEGRPPPYRALPPHRWKPGRSLCGQELRPAAVVLFPALRLRDTGRRSHLNLETQVAVWRVPRDRDGDLGKRTLGTGHPATLLPPAEAQRLPPIQKAEHRVPGACGRVRRADGAGRRGDAFGSLSLPRGLSTSIASFCLPRAGRHLSHTVSPSASPADSPLCFPPDMSPQLPWGPGRSPPSPRRLERRVPGLGLDSMGLRPFLL